MHRLTRCTHLNGNASHLVTYAGHLQDVGAFYPEFITLALEVIEKHREWLA